MADDWAQLNPRIRATFNKLIHQRDAATPGYTCPRCHQPIPWHLPYRDPITGRVNPQSKSVDHITELQDGGALLDPANAQTVHLVCNEAKGSKRWHERRAETRQRASLHIDPATL